MPVSNRVYLGTDLDPATYYQVHYGTYNNPHAPGIRYIIDKLMHHLEGKVLDLGCGNGLASLILWSYSKEIEGVDAEPRMVRRYETETYHHGSVGNYWDELPKASSAVFCYSLHLCPASRVPMVNYRLCEAGVQCVIVVSPFKARRENWVSFRLVEEVAEPVGPDDKTIYGRVYRGGAPCPQREASSFDPSSGKKAGEPVG